MDMQPFHNPASQGFLATAPAGRWDRRLASVFIVLSFLSLLVIAPFARTVLPPVPQFVPAYESALWLCDVLTAVLLLGQFHRSRSPSVLALSTGYLVSTFIIPPHLLSFPGVFSPTGLLGGVGQTTAWLYILWHTAFPLFVLLHSLAARREARTGWRLARPGLAIALAVLFALAFAAAATALALHPDGILPTVSVNGRYDRMLTTGVAPAMLLCALAALGAIWRNRRGSVLDVWLTVVMSGWICDVTLSSMVSNTRFDLGWYGGRVFALASGAFLLAVLLLDLSRLYGRLAEALEDARAQNEALVRSREELMRVQRLEAVGQLTGGIAHDFNNILTAVGGCLDMIARKPGDPDRVVQLARHASNAADRGAQLIRQLLTFSRRQALRPQVLNPNDLLVELRTLARKALGESVELQLDLAEDLERVWVDAAEFQAAVLNLVSNARDAMPEGGVLNIRTRNVQVDHPPSDGGRMAGAYVLVAVSDTGEGMDEATLARVFEPFFTTKDIGRGTGLGLSQVYGFVESAGGFVTIQSEPGQGATVSLHLPRSLAEPPPPPAEPPARIRGGERVRILVVEDDPDVMTTTAETLRDAGYEVVTATGGEEALEILLRDRRIEVLFSDVAMPGPVDGVQLAHAGLLARPGLKVLLTSGYSEGLLQHRGLDEGLPTLAKPYHRDELLRRLEALMRAPAAQKGPAL